MQNRTKMTCKKTNAPAWQIEYIDAYKEYLGEFRSLGLKNYKPISFQEFTIFHTWQDLNKPLKEKIERLSS